jgi:N-acyl homoserine lactone hydrolase
MKIIPLKTGSIYCNKGITTTLGKGLDQWITIPSIAWYVHDKENNNQILVDTGMCSTEQANQHHYPGSKQEDGQRIDLALKKIGVNIKDINIIILTHLHWDHCQNLHLFKNAKFYVQRKELEFARNPIPIYYNSYDTNNPKLTPAFQDVNFELLDGEKEIIPNIEVFPTPGHSPGHQSVLVKTRKGNYVIAGDAVMSYENLKEDLVKNIPFVMIGRYMDVKQCWESFRKIKEKADLVLPGHEPKIFEYSEYPPQN